MPENGTKGRWIGPFVMAASLVGLVWVASAPHAAAEEMSAAPSWGAGELSDPAVSGDALSAPRGTAKVASDLQGEAQNRFLASPARNAVTESGLVRLEAAEPAPMPAVLRRMAELAGQLPPEPPAAATDSAKDPAPAPLQRRILVRPGDTLLDLLTGAGVDHRDARAALTSLKRVYDPRRLKAGQALELDFERTSESDQLRFAALSMDLDIASELKLARDHQGLFSALTIDRPLALERVRVGGAITSSLYQAAAAAGLPSDALAQLLKIFSWDVDFQREIRRGDRFEAVVEQLRDRGGRRSGDGKLLFASLRLRDRELVAYRFDRPDGSFDFYDASGLPLRKWLLRTPIDGARLSSTFGPRRHPILGYTRMHKGVDFAAPSGTPILAAGDATVDLVGVNRGYGRYIRLRHNADYSTAYAHLSRFAPGMEAGRSVKQGQVIGYVGSTGLSSGPHLHYEVLRGGAQINPLSIKTMDAARLAGAELKRFRNLVAGLDNRRQPPVGIAQILRAKASASAQ